MFTSTTSDSQCLPVAQEVVKDKSKLFALVIVLKVVLEDMLDVFGCGDDHILPNGPGATVLLGVFQHVLVHPVTVMQSNIKEGGQRRVLRGGSWQLPGK